jgi:GrpB-like predicted nucleotidyltransferase (UPF0157 family)
MFGTKYGKVELINYHPTWSRNFLSEKRLIFKVFDMEVVEVEHVGSTSIPGIDSKPTIDVLVGLSSLKSNSSYDKKLIKIGYQFRPDHPVPGRLHYAKIKEGVRLFNLSLCVYKNEFWNNHVMFRDYLVSHPECAKKYNTLKHALAKQCPNNTVKYTEGKNKFINSVLNQAKNQNKS